MRALRAVVQVRRLRGGCFGCAGVVVGVLDAGGAPVGPDEYGVVGGEEGGECGCYEDVAVGGVSMVGEEGKDGGGWGVYPYSLGTVSTNAILGGCLVRCGFGS